MSHLGLNLNICIDNKHFSSPLGDRWERDTERELDHVLSHYDHGDNVYHNNITIYYT